MKFDLLFIVKSFLVFLFYCLAIGCHPKGKLRTEIYFNQHKDSLLALIVEKSEPTIQPGDKLDISVYALDPLSVAAFNIKSLDQSGSGSGSSTGYLVDNDGTIGFPQLGRVLVKGYKQKQLVDTLTNKLSKFVNDPMVLVHFMNFKITIIGEVNSPKVLIFPEGKANLIEAIGMSGDLSVFARRDNIQVIREKDGRREFGEVDLLKINSFNSPYYNLQQNDIIYVQPNKSKSSNTDQTLFRSLSIITSVMSVISTIFVLVINITK